MIFDHSGLFLDRFQPTSNGPGIPFIKVTPGTSRIAIVPEVTEACLDSPGSGHLQVGLFEFIKRLGEGFIEILFVNKSGIPGACQTSISGFLECFVLLATHFIDGLIIQHSALLQVYQAADIPVPFTEWLLINAKVGNDYRLSP